MLALDFASIVTVALVSVLAALVALLIASLRDMRTKRTGPATLAYSDADSCPTPAIFLFSQTALTDCSAAGEDLLRVAEGEGSDWDRLAQLMVPRFPGFPRNPPDKGLIEISSTDPGDVASVRIEGDGPQVHVTVLESMPVTSADRHLYRLSRIRERAYREMVDRAPYPIWLTDAAGQVRLANTAHADLARQTGRAPEEVLATGLALPDRTTPTAARVNVTPGGTEESARWFDVSVQRGGRSWFHYATDASPVIRAEVAQRSFVQTLTRTFALLSTGLAIFDKDRRLNLFNPAMLDLTGLSPEFLSSRPSMPSFFDALRDKRIMPEPKNYTGWREAISDLDARAADGSYRDTWSLPSGVTYRVSGRPYPDGAVAFLFEDISSEIGVSRTYQQFVKRVQSAIDSTPDAMAIFSPEARVVMRNAAYLALWNLPDTAAGTDETVQDATKHWQSLTEPTPAWGELRDFVGDFAPRSEWETHVVMLDGKDISCRFTPLSDGSTLATFRAA